MNNSEKFYKELRGFGKFEQFVNSDDYSEVPPDWLVAIADVRGSTEEISKGRYREVNAVGAASIAAVINALKPLEIPFVFGGDGAAFCFPGSKKDVVASALLASKELAKVEFKMELIIGIVPVADLRKYEVNVLVGKFQPYEHYQQAMFNGNGISLAEELVKRGIQKYQVNEQDYDAKGSFEGFECRWDEIPSPHEETISILIQSVSSVEETQKIFEDINLKIRDIFGGELDHHPIRKENLSLSFSLKKLCSEAAIRTKLGNNIRRILYILKLMLLNLVGKWFMHKNKVTKNTNWGKYKERLVTNTDFRKFDDLLRMVISGTEKQRNKLVNYLEELWQARKIIYGVHSSHSSLVTCLVEDYETEHVHFLDGSNGGYAFAALELKKKINELHS